MMSLWAKKVFLQFDVKLSYLKWLSGEKDMEINNFQLIIEKNILLIPELYRSTALISRKEMDSILTI